jgi:S-adenosylmethionine hydrolase
MGERSGYLARAVASAALLFCLTGPPAAAQSPNGIVVYETDFGTKDGAVSAMRGVARSVDRDLILEDLTHEIPAFDVWEAAYRLDQTARYWPSGTVFVIVVDPGAGTERKSIVMRSRSGQIFVAPDNGVLTLVAESLGVDAVREIDETANRLPGTEGSPTFFGRDVFSYTGARLAAGKVAFDAVGPALAGEMVRLDYRKPNYADGRLTGMIPVLDVQFGNVWTNIDRATFDKLGLAKGQTAKVAISAGGEKVYEGEMPYVDAFGDVAEGDPLLYFNSEGDVALAINYGDFAGTAGIGSGPDWTIEITR